MSVRVRIATLLVGAVVVAFAAVGIPALGAQPHDASARTLPAAASKGYSAKLSYDETNPGKQRGSALLGIQGHGAFSAKLGANAALEAAVIALALIFERMWSLRQPLRSSAVRIAVTSPRAPYVECVVPA